MDKKIIIAKRLYAFEVKKKFQYVRHYKLNEKTPFDKLKSALASILKGKPKEETKGTKEQIKPSSPFNPLIIAGTVFFVFLILVAGWIYITTHFSQQTTEITKAPERPDFSISIKEKGIINSGDRGTGRYAAYIRLNMSFSGVDSYNLTLTPYKENLPSQVFVLQSQREQAQGYDDFLSSLKKELSKKRIIVNEVDFEKLETIPGASVVIMPTGNLPEELLGINSNIDLNKLISRGVIVIYIGQKFDKVLTKNGLTKPNQNIIAGLPITFEEKNLQTENLALYQPLYLATGAGAGTENMQIYGSISVIKNGDGALIFVPQTIDGGWVDENGQAAPEKAGKDIAKIILETRWDTIVGNSKEYSQQISNKSDNAADFFTVPFTDNVKSIKIQLEAHAKNNITIGQMKIVPVKKEVNGNIYVEGGEVVTPQEVTERNTRLIASLSEDTTDRKQLFLKITKNGQEITDRLSLGTQSLQAELPINSPIDMDNGEYIASVIDSDNHVYAQTYLKVAFIDIQQKSDQTNAFVIQREGKPQQMRKIQVIVDNTYGPYVFENTDTVVIDLSKDVSGGTLTPGDHVFTFNIGKIKKEIKITIPKSSNIFTDPLFIGTIIAAVIITGIGVFLAKQEKIVYQIDVPDFPSVAKVNVPLKKEAILNIFDKVNEDYKWKYSPLTISEIRNGFKKMIYQGKPIYLTDYNIEYLLNKLEAKGYVKEQLNYYAPAKWEEETKRTIGFLARFRKIRDICVSNAVPFSQLDENESCDTEITAVGQKMFVHIYDKDRDLQSFIKRILGTIADGMTIVLFKNEISEHEFNSYISSSTKALLSIKLEVEGGSVALMTLDEFEARIKELKGV